MESIINFFIESYSSKSYSMITLEIIASYLGSLVLFTLKKRIFWFIPQGLFALLLPFTFY